MSARFRSRAQSTRQKIGQTLVAALLLAGVLLIYKYSMALASAGSTAVRSGAAQNEQGQEALLGSLPAKNSGGGSGGGGSSSTGSSSGDSTVDEFWRVVRSPIAQPDPAAVEERCGATRGDWCGRYYAQTPIPWLPPPRGNHSCLWGCNFVGVCDALRGWCRCPAGWTGDDCSTRLRRPCSQHYRAHGFEPYDDHDDLKKGGTTMACADLCDEDVGMCYCNSTFAHGRVPADPSLPPGTPPQRVGRPIPHNCRRSKDDAGNPTPQFGTVEPDLLYGEKGWCQADQPEFKCGCLIDGMDGPYCETPTEAFCLNQCNGHGECHSGWCKCHEGWFGHDCAFRLNTTEWTPGMEDTDRPWLKKVVKTPVARDPEPGATRRRPLIYVYELPPMYTSHMLQYRVGKGACAHRLFSDNNASVYLEHWLYNIETGLHEMLLQSEHRTLDPEEADFFYMPVYLKCMIFPVLGSNDFPFFHGGPAAMRTHAATNMLIEIYHWVRSRLPYWDRNGGRDHILLSAHDEGSCWVPAVLRPAIVLSHWGRTEVDHISGTGYWPDNYTADSKHPVYQPEGHVGKLGRFPCYDASKDMVIPPMFSPNKFKDSPALGAPARERNVLAFFKGRLQFNNPSYSRGIRQFLTNHSSEHDWWGKHKIFIGDDFPPGEEPGYSRMLTSSVFAFAIMGDGWSSRFEDALMHGCIPVIIQDGVDVAWSSVLDVDSFSIRVEQKDMTRIPEILKAVSQERVAEMQRNIKKVWRRYMWTTTPMTRDDAVELLKRLDTGGTPGPEGGQAEDPAAQADGDGQEQEDEVSEEKKGKKGKKKAKGGGGDRPQPALDGPYDPAQDDAFSTLMQWLYSRVDDLGAHAQGGR